MYRLCVRNSNQYKIQRKFRFNPRMTLQTFTYSVTFININYFNYHDS